MRERCTAGPQTIEDLPRGFAERLLDAHSGGPYPPDAHSGGPYPPDTHSGGPYPGPYPPDTHSGGPCPPDVHSGGPCPADAPRIRVRVEAPRLPRVCMGAQEERDRRRPSEAGRTLGHHRQPRPGDIAGETQVIEHRRVVAVDARRQDRSFPRAGSQFVAVELLDDRAHAIRPRETVRWVHVLPDEEEAHEVGRRDRLDLRAQAIQRVAVDSRQQRSIAPLIRLTERSPEHDAVGFERDERRFDVGLFDAERRGERGGGRRPDDRQSTAKQLGDRVLARPRLRRARRRRIDRRLEHGVGMDRPEFRDPFSREPCRRAGAGRCDSPRFDQRGEECFGDRAYVIVGEKSRGDERVVQFVGVARIGPLLVAHAVDRTLIQRAQVAVGCRVRRAARHDRLRAAFFERRVIQEGVRPRVEDLVRERRRLGCVAGDEPQSAGVNAIEQRRERRVVHRLFEAITDRLLHQRMIGNLPVAGNVLEARGGVRKDRRHQIVGEHALQRRRDLLAAAAPRHGERDGRIPAPARLKDGRVEERLYEHVARGRRMEIPEDVREGERVLRPEREQQRVLGRRGLQLEVELAAEALAQRQSPRFVDAAAERCVQHELHAAGLVEKPLEDEGVLRRQHAEHAMRIRQIRDDLFGGGRGERGFAGQAIAAFDVGAKIADGTRQLVAARRRLAEPEGQRRRRAFRVGDTNDAGADLQHLP